MVAASAANQLTAKVSVLEIRLNSHRSELPTYQKAAAHLLRFSRD